MRRIFEGGIFLFGIAIGFAVLLWIEGSNLLSDPAKDFYKWSGWGAFACLTAGLILPKGRVWGLLALAIALLHLSVFVFFDFYFDYRLMAMEIGKKPYILAGVFSLVLMGILGGFSFAGKFDRRLVYGAMGSVALAMVHIALLLKVIAWYIWGVFFLSGGILAYKIWQKWRKNRKVPLAKREELE